jgi:hypothetical protein
MEPTSQSAPAKTTHWGIIIILLVLVIAGSAAWYIITNKYSPVQADTTAVTALEQATTTEYAYLYKTPAVCNKALDKCLFFYNPFGMLSNPDPKSIGTTTEVTIKNFSKLSTVCGGEMRSTKVGKALLQQKDANTSDEIMGEMLETLCDDMVDKTFLVIAEPILVDSQDVIAQLRVKDLEGLKQILPYEVEAGLGDIYFDGNDIVWKIFSYSTTEYRLKWDAAHNRYDTQNITAKQIPGTGMYEQ